MDITAKLNNLRIAPRKVRLVTGLIAGMNYTVAKNHLTHLVKRSSHPLVKLLDSAAANGFNNLGLVKENLFIKSIFVNEGAVLKRYKPKGFGSAMPIAKRTSHVTIVLSERVAGMKATIKKEDKPVEEVKDATKTKTDKKMNSDKKMQPKDIVKNEKATTGPSKVKKFFRRKAV